MESNRIEFKQKLTDSFEKEGVAFLSPDAFIFENAYVRLTFPYQTGFEKTSVKTSVKILYLMTENPEITISELSEALNITPRSVERNIQRLQKDGLVRRVGADKGGHWQIVE